MMENNYLTQQVSLVVIPQQVWEGVNDTLQELKAILINNKENVNNNQWIESTEARKMLKVSPKTWQTYRDERRIPFSQFGRKIYVKRADLEKFMEQHYISARNQKGGIV